MLTLSIKNFLSAIDSADAFSLPAMNTGTKYIFDSIYKRLLHGEVLKLSEINFDNFELDDINIMRDLYEDVLVANERKADSLTHTLQSIQPRAVDSVFV